MECCCSNWAEYITAGAAVFALIVSWYQYQLHRDRERSKVFSSLNERYVKNGNGINFYFAYLKALQFAGYKTLTIDLGHIHNFTVK